MNEQTALIEELLERMPKCRGIAEQRALAQELGITYVQMLNAWVLNARPADRRCFPR